MKKIAIWFLLCLAAALVAVGMQPGAGFDAARTQRTWHSALKGDPSREQGSWVRPAEKPPTPSDYVIKLNQMDTFYDEPGEYGHLLEGHKHGFRSLSFILTETHPGGGPPLHTHATEEAHVLLDGSMLYMIGDKTFTAEGPYIARVPAGVPHTFMNSGKKVLKLVAVFPDGKISYDEIGKNPLTKGKR